VQSEGLHKRDKLCQLASETRGVRTEKEIEMRPKRKELRISPWDPLFTRRAREKLGIETCLFETRRENKEGTSGGKAAVNHRKDGMEKEKGNATNPSKLRKNRVSSEKGKAVTKRDFIRRKRAPSTEDGVKTRMSAKRGGPFISFENVKIWRRSVLTWRRFFLEKRQEDGRSKHREKETKNCSGGGGTKRNQITQEQESTRYGTGPPICLCGKEGCNQGKPKKTGRETCPFKGWTRAFKGWNPTGLTEEKHNA